MRYVLYVRRERTQPPVRNKRYNAISTKSSTTPHAIHSFLCLSVSLSLSLSPPSPLLLELFLIFNSFQKVRKKPTFSCSLFFLFLFFISVPLEKNNTYLVDARGFHYFGREKCKKLGSVSIVGQQRTERQQVLSRIIIGTDIGDQWLPR